MQNTHLEQPKHIIHLALRFFIVCALLVLVILLIGDHVLSLLVPLFKWEIGFFAPYFKIVEFRIVQDAASSVFLLSVSIDELIVVGGRFVLPNEAGVANATAVASYVWQITVLYGAMLFVWPFTNRQEVRSRILLGLPTLCILLMLDTPFALLSAIWHLIYQAYAPGKLSLLIEWSHFMMGGGRLMLAVVAGMLTVCVSNVLSQKAN